MSETEPTTAPAAATTAAAAPADWYQWSETRDASVSGEHGVLSLVATHWVADGPATALDGLPGVWAADGDRVGAHGQQRTMP